jgi:hypothetical protein
MKTRTSCLLLLLCAWVSAARSASWEVVLLKPAGCDMCGFVEEVLKRNAQLRQVVLDDGAGGQVTAQVLRRNSAALSGQEWQELRALPGFNELQWRQRTSARSALILLKRDGVVVSAGDITDSSDLLRARYPAELTTPDINRDLAAVRDAQWHFVSDLYLRSFNLSWFYRLALDPTILDARNAARVKQNTATLSPPLGKANVLLVSTASGASDNEIFNALRIEEIRDVLSRSLSTSAQQLHVFYGGGNAAGANALEVRNGSIGLVKRNVEGANPFTPDAALQIFQSIHSQPGSRNLLVLIGHGNPDGAGMWSSPTPLSPAVLHSLHEYSGGDNVLVSGNCFGGIMARAMSCGFFGARPDIIATGCQADAAEVAQSRDYLHMFFSSLEPAVRQAADADGNGVISFAEAHWYASTEGDPRNVTYTGIDALADTYFESHPEALPHSLPVREILALTNSAPPAESRTLRSLLAGYSPDVVLLLTNLADLAGRWRPDGTPRTMASQLTRRLLYLLHADDHRADVARLQSCENRSVAAFLRP